MTDAEERELPFGMRKVCAHLSPAPEALIFESGQALHQHLLDGREISEEPPVIEEWIRELEQQQDRELRVQYWRGVFLDRFFALEQNLGAILANHLEVGAEKGDEWAHWMLGRVSFNQKMQLVQRVINTRDLQDEFPSMYEHLEQMNRLRNVLAHGGIEPMEHPGIVSFLYFQQGVFKAQKFRVLDLYLNVLRLTSLTWQIGRLSSVVQGREWKFAGAEDAGLEFVRQLDTARSGPCPECGTPRAGLKYEAAEDAWVTPDFTGQQPTYVACTNPDCTQYEPRYDPDLG